MNDKLKLALVAGLFVAAAVVYITLNSPFQKAAGAGKEMLVDCQACRYHGKIMLDEALKKGAAFSGETGWSMACPSCGKTASVHIPLPAPASQGSDGKSVTELQEAK